MLKQLIAIACGGAVGAVLRYLLSTASYSLFGRGFPYGTLLVNLLGCFLMGCLSVLLIERVLLSVELRAAILIGVLGSLTTFSTFSLETLTLYHQGQYIKVFLNIGLSILLCLMATHLGMVLARRVGIS